MADATFTEVLEVQIDVESFRAGLAGLESAYTEFVERVNAKGLNAGNIINVGSISQIQEQLGALEKYLQQFDASVTESMDGLDAEFKKVSENINSVSQSTIDAKAKLAKGSVVGGSATEEEDDNFPITKRGMRRSVLSMLGGGNASLLEMVANMGKFLLLWRGVGAAIELAAKAITAPMNFIKSGIEYLSDLQAKAAELQGVIAATVKFSGDLATNFNLSGTAAKNVVEQLQTLSAQTGITVEMLERTFKSVLESGGMNFVHNLQGAVDLTKQLTLAMQASGASQEAQRRLQSEIPQLLSGTINAHSRILEVLHLSVGQWQAIRSEALAHGDLVEQLASRLQPYLGVLAEADTRQQSLVAQLELMSKRIAAAIALPLWQSFLGILQETKTLLQEHGVQIEAFGRSVLGLGESFVELGYDFYSLFSPFKSLTSDVKFFGDTLAVAVFAARSIIDFLVAGVQQLSTLINVALDPDKIFSKNAWKKAFGDMAQEGQDAVNKIYNAAADASNAMNGKGSGDLFSGHGPLMNQGSAKTKPLVDPKEAAEHFKAIQEQYRLELDNTQNAFKEQEAEIKQQIETGTISVQQGTNQRITAISNELLAIDNLIKKYRELTNAVGVPAPDKNSFLTSLTKTGQDASLAAIVGIGNARAINQKNEETIALAHDKALEATAKQHAQAMLTLYRQEATEGYHTKVEAFDMEVAASKAAHNAIIESLQKELTAVGATDQKKAAIQDQIAEEDQRYTDSTIGNAQKRIKIAIDEATQIQAIKDKEQVVLAKTAKEAASLTASRADADKIITDNQKIADSDVKEAEDALKSAQANEKRARQLGIVGDALEKLQLQTDEAQQKVVQAQEEKRKADSSAGTAVLDQYAFGPNVDKLGEAFKNFNASVISLGNAVGTFANAAQTIFNAVSSGMKSGGVMGGIGGGMSAFGGILNGLQGVGNAIPVVGAVMEGVGTLFGFIGGLFTAAARRIGDEVKKAIQDTMSAFSTGQQNLIQTITALQQERDSAIERLSGKKGGQDQLNQILPQLNQQIASLQQQQKQTLTTFQQQLSVLQTHSSILGGFLSTWQQINKQVLDYLNAGGDANTAAQFLSENLRQQLLDTTTNLQQADQQALSDAQNLNDLLLQKVQLARQYAQQEFALKNADSVEREAVPGIQAAINYQLQKQQDQEQLTKLDAQISLYQQRVSMEKQVFSIANDTATIQAQSNALNIAQLATQIQQWKDMQTIIENIHQNPDGTYSQTVATGTVTSAPTQATLNLEKQLTQLNEQLTKDQNRADRYTSAGESIPSGLQSQMASLEAQIQKLQANMPQTVATTSLAPNLTGNPGGLPPVNPNNPSGVVIGSLNVTVNGNVDPESTVNAIYNELILQGRYGLNTSYQ